ncbi:carboxylating nicotinate-nucleotide diphosphorylase [Dyadobacter chenwenxiniae]|uniref:Probable nicotinate-nucleotide pyrophosphorylase [carboxylating] n=1 Tax=Dyadobacter chenwenxiniae TaxID=2906456 RepID=A0A9X1TF24_9BACT|nr:carboxylating nicotinate-nucleotide diphosphorylase [Dyadobacter chenwenxiniae]MCF0049714.1 carboxylating nicotinate-nucleotide diphosphorylase [Dyadobacter chenwenxiniae]MCF0062140.1 carboxylating nicotinate-nucleotide diphosphorylase [Dyadobacter chenwenxiniae]UON81944.1 carboxylating nicotinate-nucleotide diphosphorylase [Dyadobacter chenwenxiniae]
METNPHELRDLIRLALLEDIGDGDHSSLSCVPENATKRAQLLVKQDGILAGVEVAQIIFDETAATYNYPPLKINVLLLDGTYVKSKDVVFTVEGNARLILKAERLVLNTMQRMSGIATYARQMSDLIKDLPVKLLDTRKTTPNFRVFEKLAVKIGGAVNHRMGLYDMIMLKDNHVDYAGGIEPAILRASAYRQELGKNLKIEIETRNLEEVDEVLRVGMVDIIMLDNFSLNDLREAVKRIGGRYETEASGNITEKTLRAVAETGIDGISSGALTHQARSLDLSLKAF